MVDGGMLKLQPKPLRLVQVTTQPIIQPIIQQKIQARFQLKIQLKIQPKSQLINLQIFQPDLLLTGGILIQDHHHLHHQ